MVGCESSCCDSSVLVPSVLRDTLLTLAEDELFEPLWSTQILAEVRRTVVARRGVPPEVIDRTLALMARAFADACVTGWESLVADLDLPDPDDRHVLAAAIAAQASVIVTANLRDFPAHTLDLHGVSAVHPDAFLLGLATAHSEHVMEALSDQVARYRRPAMTISGLLDRLTRAGAPDFATAARDRLHSHPPPI